MTTRSRLVLLFVKDLWLQRWTVPLLFGLELASYLSLTAQFPPAMRMESGTFLQGVASIGTFMMAYRIFASEDANSSVAFLKTLPLNTAEIFTSKLLFIWGYVLFNAITINLAYVVIRMSASEWMLGAPDFKPIWIGIAIQSLFAMLLAWVAVWTDSQKAIWVPFPVMLVLMNAYTFVLSPTKPGNETVRMTLELLSHHWLIWSCVGLIIALLMAIVVVAGAVRKKSLL